MTMLAAGVPSCRVIPRYPGVCAALKSISPLVRLHTHLVLRGYHHTVFDDGPIMYVWTTGDFVLRGAGRYVEVGRFYIQAEWRGQGIGETVLEELCAAADEAEVQLRLWASPLVDRPDRNVINPYVLASWYARVGGFEPLYQSPRHNGIRMVRG